MKNISSGKIEYSQDMNLQLRDLISKILKVDPSKRLSLKEIKEHPYIVENIKKLSQSELDVLNGNYQGINKSPTINLKKLTFETFYENKETETTSEQESNTIIDLNSYESDYNANLEFFDTSYVLNKKLIPTDQIEGVENKDNDLELNIIHSKTEKLPASNSNFPVENPVLMMKDNYFNGNPSENNGTTNLFSTKHADHGDKHFDFNLKDKKSVNNQSDSKKEDLKNLLNKVLEENTLLKKELKSKTERFNYELSRIREELNNKYNEVIEIKKQKDLTSNLLEELKISLVSKESTIKQYEEEILEKNSTIKLLEEKSFRRSNPSNYFDENEELISDLKKENNKLTRSMNSLELENDRNKIKLSVLEQTMADALQQKETIEEQVCRRYQTILDSYENTLRQKEMENYGLEK
eukprot:CAMPEP_0170527460 /NCGR_PEP_ID=MMETSP0209-20121228/12911_1 /TAXON_ID=665100 ORGANISM="Litonotus pictus, Strain P1" /NCGR_SAMPLE_ID=MMETSP0209 /ASSEMBLY_ACC=CAM_ASM_000301 /LENGTH=409 /DNA_ID=CAMNT_0010817973 /DNA_START=700 /DNA_END=1926 /DNA_ORIENTATION=+